jgi:hypothetical protein
MLRVIRLFPLLTAIVTALVLFVTDGATAAGSAQKLGVVLHGDAASTERLPHYRISAPIAVHIGGDAARFASLKLTAHGPDGKAVSAPLARSGDAFIGNLRLASPGLWNVAFTTQLGTALASIPLDVVSDDGADVAARITFALGALAIVSGIVIVYRVASRRRRGISDV